MNLDNFKQYLPKYLSSESERELFECLKDFPKSMHKVYTNSLYSEKIIFQGDGLSNMYLVDIPSLRIEKNKALVLSNTCDIDPNNPRYIPPKILYSPILNLSKYEKLLLDKSNKTEAQIEDHIRAIREQKVSNIFYLPQKYGKGAIDESIVFFDRILNVSISSVDIESLLANRLFVLSNYGFYLLLYKLSIHFTRIKESIDRI